MKCPQVSRYWQEYLQMSLSLFLVLNKIFSVFYETNYFDSLHHHYNCGENVSQWAASCSRIKTNIFIIELLIFILLNYILKRNYNWKAFCLQLWRTEVWQNWSSNFVHSRKYQQGKPCIGPCLLLAIHFKVLSLLCHAPVSLTDMTSGLSVYTETSLGRNS